ncbi:hydantoinase B/oxoprolinase family protein [Mesorhizobium sp. L2C084A000]|uniref:hydantoinase B/oxoprolinase family protein n=1 Tax=Mesorhizobium sp. L2C084A000 TaxID=1287116 RepID=UPI0003D06A54|nr:hydantoinase B/oxoprolinase family protein [Mesorhizobium sp. L2C084A000]ESZ23991.1 hydantoinase [Mesorhizobium sp. L2C084A000]
MSETNAPARPDPVGLAIIQKQLDYVSTRMGWAMTRTARSPIFSQSHDFSCFLTDSQGQVIAQADGLPIHSGGGGFAVRAVLAKAETISDGDVFLLSDPYVAGGNHLPDWTLVRPVFVEETLCGFACNRAHQSDISGGVAGTYNAGATEIFHEGIRLPVLKLVEKGKVRRDLWDLLLLNTRCPELMDGDLLAMLGSTLVGGERLAEIARRLGVDVVRSYFEAVLDAGCAALRRAIKTLPAGEYSGEDSSDNNCFEELDVPVKVKLTVKDGELHFDFTGSAPQSKGFKNSSVANTHSAVYLAVAAYFDPSIARNEGTYRAVSITAPNGTVVNANAPAPMTMNTVFPATEIIFACWKALAAADPVRGCAGWSKVAYGVSSGQRRGETYVMYHWHGSPAGGAVNGRDGFHISGHVTTLGGLTLPNAEEYEHTYPVRIIHQEFRQDSAGPGKYRGGAGIDYEVEMLEPSTLTTRSEGVGALVSYGLEGGGSGAGGDVYIRKNGECADTRLPRYGTFQMPSMRLTILAGGGGGYGDPLARHPDAVVADVNDGIISKKAAREIYGCILTENTKSIDLPATLALRDTLTSPAG